MVNSGVGKQTECFLTRFGPLPEHYIAPGSEAGIARGHPVLARFLFPLLIAIVIALITDIDTPRGGLIMLDDRPLLEVKDTLK